MCYPRSEKSGEKEARACKSEKNAGMGQEIDAVCIILYERTKEINVQKARTPITDHAYQASLVCHWQITEGSEQKRRRVFLSDEELLTDLMPL